MLREGLNTLFDQPILLVSSSLYKQRVQHIQGYHYRSQTSTTGTLNSARLFRSCLYRMSIVMMSAPPSIFIESKKDRIANCKKINCGYNGCYMCGRCRRMGQKLCRMYHSISVEVEKTIEMDTAKPLKIAKLAAMELEARLLYEFVFNFIEEEDLFDGKWLSSGLRDYGHTQRMFKLYRLFIRGADVLPKEHKWMVCKKM